MSVVMQYNFRAQVDRGVALLDREQPGWRDDVDPTKLDMSSTCGCILGQVFDRGPFAVHSGYIEGLTELNIWSADYAAEYGFSLVIPRGTNEWSWLDAWSHLRAEWLRRLS